MYGSFKSDLRCVLRKYQLRYPEAGVGDDVLRILQRINNTRGGDESYSEVKEFVHSLVLGRVFITDCDVEQLVEKILRLQRVFLGIEEWRYALPRSNPKPVLGYEREKDGIVGDVEDINMSTEPVLGHGQVTTDPVLGHANQPVNKVTNTQLVSILRTVEKRSPCQKKGLKSGQW